MIEAEYHFQATEEEWPTWSASKSEALVIDGSPLLATLGKIHKQLEYLHSRVNANSVELKTDKYGDELSEIHDALTQIQSKVDTIGGQQSARRNLSTRNQPLLSSHPKSTSHGTGQPNLNFNSDNTNSIHEPPPAKVESPIRQSFRSIRSPINLLINTNIASNDDDDLDVVESTHSNHANNNNNVNEELLDYIEKLEERIFLLENRKPTPLAINSSRLNSARKAKTPRLTDIIEIEQKPTEIPIIADIKQSITPKPITPLVMNHDNEFEEYNIHNEINIDSIFQKINDLETKLLNSDMKIKLLEQDLNDTRKLTMKNLIPIAPIIPDNILKLIDSNTNNIFELNLKLQEITQKLDVIEPTIEEINDKLKKFDENFAISDQKFEKNDLFVKDITDKYQSLLVKHKILKDTLDTYDIRIGSSESIANKSLGIIENARSSLENILQTKIANILTDIKVLQDNHIDRYELLAKADIELLALKADTDIVNRLNDITQDISKKIVIQHHDTNDKIKTVVKTSDDKLEYLYNWIIKKFNNTNLENGMKELLQANQLQQTQRENEGNTNIGKVKCLVCDQYVHQDKVTEIVHGGPAFKSHLKSFHIPPTHHNMNSPNRHLSPLQPVRPKTKPNTSNNNNPVTDDLTENNNIETNDDSNAASYVVVESNGVMEETSDNKSKRNKLLRLAAVPTIMGTLEDMERNSTTRDTPQNNSNTHEMQHVTGTLSLESLQSPTINHFGYNDIET